jgi:DNA adenine methylase
MKLLFSRFGGKKQKAKTIIDIFPQHTTYVEPFLGSGAIFLVKDKSQVNVLNDLDPLVFNIFDDLIDVSSQFDNNTYDWTPDKDRWNTYKESLSDQSLSPCERMFRSLYITSHSWSGIGTSFTSNRYKEGWTYNKKLSDYEEKMEGVIVRQQDYTEIIREFDGPDTLFYLDPPYDIALKKSYYEYDNSMTLEHLRDILRTVQGKFVLSLDITDQTTELFKEFNILQIPFKYASSKTKKIKYEYIITNFPLYDDYHDVIDLLY